MQVLHGLLRQWGVHPDDIAGTSLTGEIPFSESLVNRLVAKALDQNAHIASVLVTLHDGDEALVRVEPRLRLVPAVPIVVRIERQPDLPHDPTLRLRWAMRAAGPLTFVAGKIAGAFNALPGWIRIDGDLIVLDLRGLLRTRGLEDALALVRRAAVHTRSGAVVLQFQAGLG
jgi:hypothetical protein